MTTVPGSPTTAWRCPVFAVTGARSLESRFAARHGEVTAIVGRDQELALLVERWRQTKTGEGQVVLLSGEAGVGKSRITEAVIEAARAESHFLLRYQCSPYHSDSALYPAIQQLIHAAGFTEADSVEQRLERLEALLVTSTDRISAVSPLSLQLRAARDLATLWAERGERIQAADLLAPIYGAFTEGFDTLDLVESKTLLDELRN